MPMTISRKGKHRIRLFVCYLLPGSDNFSADGKVYYRISEARVELYTDQKDSPQRESWKTLWTPAAFFMRNRRPGLTAKSCMRFCMCLRCQQAGKAQGRTDKEMEGAGNVCEEE